MNPRARGFSLIEVLLASVLLALLMAGAFAGVRTATRAVDSGEALIDRTNRIRVAQEFVRRQFGQALYAPFASDRGSGERIVFEGERDAVRFVSAMPGYLGHGGPYVQQLSFEREGGERRLLFRHAILNGYDGDDAAVGEGEPVLLLGGIREARFEYRALDDQGELEDWRDDWDKRARAPVMVRVLIEFEPETRMRWPELVVPLVLDPGAGTTALEPSFFTGGG
jgi:general secretion pathway protein J